MKKSLSLFLGLCLILGTMGFAFADAAFTPGTYMGTAEGFAGDVKATVTVDENAITAIEIVGADETPALGGAAIPIMAEAYVGKADAEAVDAVTGATFTSNAVKEAVTKALAAAALVAAAPAEEAKGFTPGTYEAAAQGFVLDSEVKVVVTVDENAIIAIEIVSPEEPIIIGSAAITVMEEAYVGKADAEAVDDMTGATVTSKAVKEAVAKALAAARSKTSGDYAYILLDDGSAEITYYLLYREKTGELILPDQLDGHRVTTIGDYAFKECTSVTSVTIPASVTTIGNEAFSGCSSVTSVTIPASVTNIGDYAFYKCSNLTSIAIPDSVTIIGDSAFCRCESVTSVTIPDSVTSIGDYAFSGCDSLTSVTIPDSVTTIGSFAFDDCSNLTSITIPDSVTAIGGYAFSGCTSLTSIAIPDSVTAIGGYAFSGCTSLTSITIPDSMTAIGDGAFSGCTSLTSITIPDSVVKVSANPFKRCKNLSEIIVSPDHPVLAVIDGVLFSKEDKRLICYPAGKQGTEYQIPSGIQIIGDSAFYNCTSLTSIAVPDSVTAIGDFAFYRCTGLTSVTIPDSVTAIGDYAFGGCSGLTSPTPAPTHVPTSVPTARPTAGPASCRFCGGDGICKQCTNGKCSKCSGKGYVNCSRCGGTGFCPNDNCVSGYIYLTFSPNKDKKQCSICGGTGVCPKCKGERIEKCTKCDGKGDCRYCNGTNVCMYCGGVK